MLKYKIRKFRINDYDALIKLWDESKLSYRPKGRDSRKELARQVKLPYINILIAEKDMRLIGSVMATHDGRRGWINRLAVLPEFQHQGIAMRLVKESEKWFKKQGIKIICSLIENWNKGSRKAFKKLGYIEHHDILYFSKRENADV